MPIATLPGGGGSISSIVADALGYPHNTVGEAPNPNAVPYAWGKGNPRGWDCSGFVNYVLGHDLGYTLPGGVKNFSGSWHGPVVAQYATWKGAGTVKGPPEAGDLCVWVGIGASGHIGIALGADRMISALDPQQATTVSPIQGYGPAGAPLIYRRVGASGTTAEVPALQGCSPSVLAILAISGRTLWTSTLHK